MAIGVLGTNVDAFAENFNLGEMEMIAQSIDALTTVGNVFRLNDQRIKGPFAYQNVLRFGTSGVTRRDPTSTSAATDIPVAATSDTRVKLKRAWGPYANTKDAWYEALSDAGGSVQALAQLWGQKAGEEQAQDWLNTALRSAQAALDGQSDNKLDITGAATTTLNTGALIEGAAKFGDAYMSRVQAWVVHSKAFYDLVKDQVVTLKTTGISNLALAEASPITFNKPMIVTDSPALEITTGTGTSLSTSYYTLGLVEGAVTLDNSRPLDVEVDTITGLDNLVLRIQAEYDFNVGVKGFQWDTGNGLANPTDAAIATSTNWDKTGTTKKDLAGIIIESL